MARPRIYVNRHGKPVKAITGVSFNKARRRFYIILPGGKRQEFSTWEDAHAALATLEADTLPPGDMEKIVGAANVRRALALDYLAKSAAFADLMHTPTIEGLVMQGGSFAAAALGAAKAGNALADIVGIPKQAVVEVNDRPASGPRLGDIIARWTEHKMEEKGEVRRHQREVAKRWQTFVTQVGNLYVGQISPAHFRTYHSWASRESASRTCGKWFNDHVTTVKSVLRFVRKKYPEWPWPTGILEWADSYDVKPYKPKPSNKQPMPAEVFQSLVGAADEWKRIDVAVFDTGTQAGRARKNQALRTRRDGWQLEALLRLGINCGLDPIDCERIAWENLRLDADTPHMRLPRRKVESRVGDSIERITPLLPSTVKALEAWRGFERRSRGPVFLSAAKGPYRPDRLGRAIKRLRDSKGISGDWSFKHLRNVVPSLGRRYRRPRDEREAFLGHVAGTSRFYDGDVDESFLIPLVNLLGKQYLDGEKVRRGRKTAEPSRNTISPDRRSHARRTR